MTWASKPPIGTQLDLAHPRTRKLVTYFPFWEGNGSVVRNIATPQTSATCTPSATGVLTNFVQSSTSGWSGGNSGGALRFDGTNDTVLLTAHKLLDEATISAWIRPSTVSVGTRCIIDDDVGGISRSFAFEINRTAARLSFVTAGTVILTSNTNLIVDKWYHVAAVRTGVSGSWTYTIYVNGSADGSATTGVGPQTGASVAYIGSRNNTDRFFAGDLSDFKAWDRALRPNEVVDDFAAPYAVFREPSVRKWYVSAAGGSFQPAWAYAANQTIVGGQIAA